MVEPFTYVWRLACCDLAPGPSIGSTGGARECLGLMHQAKVPQPFGDLLLGHAQPPALAKEANFSFGCVVLILPSLFSGEEFRTNTTGLFHKIGVLACELTCVFCDECLGYSNIVREVDM